MKIPTSKEIENLHRKYSPSSGAFQSVWNHCQIVSQLAVDISEDSKKTNTELIKIGALVHDIGVYKLIVDGEINRDKYITHGLLGYELLKNEGFDETICGFALRHTGVGIDKQDVIDGQLPLPIADYRPQSEEEEIVMYADKFHSKSLSPTFNSVNWYANFVTEKFGPNMASKFQALIEKYGLPDIEKLAKQHNQPIR